LGKYNKGKQKGINLLFKKRFDSIMKDIRRHEKAIDEIISNIKDLWEEVGHRGNT